MKKLSLLLFAVTLCCSLQSKNIDSLRTILKDKPTDVVVLKEIIAHFVNEPDSAISYCNYAITKLLSNKDTLMAAEFINKLAIAYYYKGDLKNCQSNLNKALNYYQKYKDKQGIGNCYNGLGVVNYEQGKLYDALQLYIKALRIKEELNDKKAMGLILNNIGNVYKDLNNINRAVEYYNKSIAINEEINNKRAVAMTLNNLGLLYHNNKAYEKAIDYYLKSLELKKEINDKHGMAMTLNNLGLTYEVLKNYPKSLSYYIQSLEIKKQIHDDLGTAMTLINIANIYRYNNNYKESFKSLKKALKKAKAIGATTQIRDAYQRYYEIYEALQDYKNALKFHKLFIATKDSMFNESSQKKLAELQEKYEVERKKYEIQKLKHEQEEAKIKIEKNNAVLSSTRTKNYFLIATVVFLALLTLILFKTSKKRKNINEQLNVALKQKDILFKEVHHRVKNNFQLISSILNLHINSIDDEKVTEELREAKNRILSMALVHEKLYKSENLEQIDFKEYLENLIEDLKKSNEVENLQINLNIENLRLNIQQSIHLGLIFNELITNSIKHGFKNLPADYFKKIKITIERISEDKWKATYEDNGLGLPDNFDLTKMDSLGINLIQLLVTQLHGELTFINKPATFVFDFRTEY